MKNTNQEQCGCNAVTKPIPLWFRNRIYRLSFKSAQSLIRASPNAYASLHKPIRRCFASTRTLSPTLKKDGDSPFDLPTLDLLGKPNFLMTSISDEGWNSYTHCASTVFHSDQSEITIPGWITGDLIFLERFYCKSIAFAYRDIWSDPFSTIRIRNRKHLPGLLIFHAKVTKVVSVCTCLN